MNVRVAVRTPKSLLNKGTGFLNGYTHSLNPYAGCTFGCSYCYVRQLPVSLFRSEPWGEWVDVKAGAAGILRQQLSRAKLRGPVTIFMSSSTDPYQPVEYKEQVTRSLLEAMAESPPDFLLVQTRSPLVTRDIDLLRELGGKVRVSMTIETDLETVRKHFTPYAPPIGARLKALQLLKEADIPVQATIAPVLPSSESFAGRLRPLVDRICIDDYFMGDGSGGARTRKLGIRELYAQLGMEEWYRPEAWRIVYDRMAAMFPADRIMLSRDGFAPF